MRSFLYEGKVHPAVREDGLMVGRRSTLEGQGTRRLVFDGKGPRPFAVVEFIGEDLEGWTRHFNEREANKDFDRRNR